MCLQPKVAQSFIIQKFFLQFFKLSAIFYIWTCVANYTLIDIHDSHQLYVFKAPSHEELFHPLDCGNVFQMIFYPSSNNIHPQYVHQIASGFEIGFQLLLKRLMYKIIGYEKAHTKMKTSLRELPKKKCKSGAVSRKIDWGCDSMGKISSSEIWFDPMSRTFVYL